MDSTLTARHSMVVAGLLAALGMGNMQRAAAETLQDPTRPPTATTLPTGDSAAPVVSGPQLQSIRLGGARSSAIISGQRVSLGERYGGAQLVKISENQVVLQGSSGMQTLTLFPAIGKSAVLHSRARAQKSARRSQ